MKRFLFTIPVLVLLSACGILAIFDSAVPDAPDLQNDIPAWDGAHILCSEDVSFDWQATTDLPEFELDDRLGFCARSMKFLALNREFGDRTTYFGVAAAVTGSLAATYSPLVRRAYSGPSWEFMQSLNLALEIQVDQAAADLRAGNRGGQGFTNGLILADINDVQTSLEALAEADPEGYDRLLEDVAGTLNPTNPMLLNAINRNPFFAAYEASLAAIRLEVGGNVEFALLEHRLKIGAALEQLIANIAPYPEITQ